MDTTSFDTIYKSSPILFFPVRLETRFDKDGDTPTLKIRIIPDQLQVQYDILHISDNDLEEGRRFWVKWFIASGDKDREFETWRQLCRKHGVNGASRIAALTHPRDLDKFRLGNELFTKRPFAYLDAEKHLIDIAAYCAKIYDQLSIIHITESSAPDKALTDNAADAFRAISATLASLSIVLDGSPDIVDYLSEKVDECVGYLNLRLDSIGLFYDRYPQFKDDPGSFDLRDSDYFAFGRLLEQVRTFREKLYSKTIPLDEMVDRYMARDVFVKDFFGRNTTVTRWPKDWNSYPAPTLPLMPDFFHIAVHCTINGKEQDFYATGKTIPSSLQVGLDLEGKEGFSLDANGNIRVPDGLKWMVDYDQAVRVGMAATVRFEGLKTAPHVDAVYAYGARKNNIPKSALETLFKSHLYWGDDFSLLKMGTPTNEVAGGRTVETLTEYELIERKYRIEILDEGDKAPENADGQILSRLLQIDYKGGPFAHAIDTENTELLNAKKANVALWYHFLTKMVDNAHPATKTAYKVLEHIGNFFMLFVSARGIAPLFRVDDQPYGIVPVSEFEDIDLGSLDTWQKKYIKLLYDSIVTIGKRWEAICDQDLIAAEGMKGKDADRKFLRMASQNPRSVRFGKRTFYYGPAAEYGADKKVLTQSNDLLRMISGMGLKDALPVADAIEDFDISTLREVVQKTLPAIEPWQADRLVSEFLDLFTYRVDAWYMAFLSYRLYLKKAGPLFIGSYGWVFNLDRKDDKEQNKDGEFILAPSIQHALTGAVLRSAYLQTKADVTDSHMCVNLSSMRARQGLRMIDGIKQGMSTGMILGADLERYLHEAYKQFKYPDGKGIEMDKCIYPLRKLFPLTVDIKAEDQRAEDYTLQVINGETLLNSFLAEWNYQGRLSKWLWDNQDSRYAMDWFRDETVGMRKMLNEDQQRVLFTLIERMADSYDALNDLLLAEGVHRLVAGDKASFAAIANFMANGSGNLPDPIVLQSPMQYAVLAHKVGLALPRAGKAAAKGLLATAEPAVNAWLAQQMGSLQNIIFYVDHSVGEQRNFYESNLQEVGLTPIEYLYLSAFPKVLARMLELGWRKRDWRNLKGGTVRILTGDPAELEPGEQLPDLGKRPAKILLYEFSLLADDLAALLARSRAMRAGDIIPAVVGESAEEELMNVEELKSRYLAVRDELIQIRVKLDRIVASHDDILSSPLEDVDVIELYELTGRCARAGMFNETPGFDSELLVKDIDKVLERPRYDQAVEKQQKFLAQMRVFCDAITERLSAAAACLPAEDYRAARPAAYIEAIQALTCKNLRVVPRFSVKQFREERPLRNQTFRSMGKDYKNVDNLTGNAFLDWMDEVAEVRPGMKLYHDIRMMRRMMDPTAESLRAGIYQTLSQDKIAFEWLGWTVSDESILDDADSLVMFERDDFNEMLENVGLVFDSWLEYIPFRKQTAGLTFHCDTPDAEAPQALLYAVAPKTSGTWGPASMRAIIQSARRLMRIRSVDPDQIYASKDNSLLGSLLTARMEDLVDTRNSPEAQITALDQARKNELVLESQKVDETIVNNMKQMK